MAFLEDLERHFRATTTYSLRRQEQDGGHHLCTHNLLVSLDIDKVAKSRITIGVTDYGDVPMHAYVEGGRGSRDEREAYIGQGADMLESYIVQWTAVGAAGNAGAVADTSGDAAAAFTSSACNAVIPETFG